MENSDRKLRGSYGYCHGLILPSKKTELTFTAKNARLSSTEIVNMNSERDICQCSELGYSPDCPNAFYQGGQLLHTIGTESRLKPRIYGPSDDDVNDQAGLCKEPGASSATGLTNLRIARERIMSSDPGMPTPAPLRRTATIASSSSESEDLYDEVRNQFPAHLSTEVATRNRTGKGQLQNDSMMMEHHRKSLRKFESLNINGQTLTGLSIGGFVVDLSKAAQKASEVAPLPPSKLPIIFADDDMNFHHHFFQGLDILLGKDIVQEIVSVGKYYEKTELHLLPMIEEMIKVGYEKSDNEITIFTKKVMTSTFDIDSASGVEVRDKMLLVSANLWGFQYIECGMQMKEPDLKMWLQSCYSAYRMIWFNTFKSSGVPQFALDGVQTRYEHASGRKKGRSSIPEESVEDDLRKYREEISAAREDMHVASQERRRRKKHHKPESTIGSFFMGR